MAKVKAERKELAGPTAGAARSPALALRKVEGKIAKLTKRETEVGAEIESMEQKLVQLPGQL